MRCTKCIECGKDGKNALCHNPYCNYVQGYGSESPTYMLVSDWVRHTWIKKNKLFSGNVEPELQALFKSSGIEPQECYFTSLVKCPVIKGQELGKNAKEGTPKKDVIEICSQYLDTEIKEKKPKVILALGAPSFNYFFPALKLSEKRCQPLWHEGYGCYVIGIYNPENLSFSVEFDLIIAKAFKQAHDILYDVKATTVPSLNYRRIKTIEELRKLVEEVQNVPVFAYDLEANSLDQRKAKLLSIGISWKINEGVSFPIYVKDEETCTKLLNNVAPKERRSLQAVLDKNPPLKSFWGNQHNEVMELIKQIFASSCKKGGHNTWYDNLVLYYNGIEVNNYTFDTMIMYHLLDEERPKGLDDLSWIFTDKGGYKMEKEKYLSTSESNYANIPVDVLLDYNCGDADCTFELYTKFKPQLFSENVAKLFVKICMPLQKELMKASITGIKIDVNYVKETQKLLQNRITEAENKIKEIAEKYYPKVKIITETSQKGKDPLVKYLNIASSKDLRELLFEKMGLSSVGLTESGANSTDESALNKLSRKNEVAKLIMEHRKANKLKTTYLDGILDMVDENHRIHPNFNVAGTVTGRLASYNPNIQQIPRDKTIKRMFIPEDGYVIAEADMSQNELRVVAGLSNDPEMNRIYDTDGDIHSEFASTVFKKPIAEVTKEERSIAKTCWDINSLILTENGYVRGKDLWSKKILDLDGKSQNQKHFIEERDGYKITLNNGQIIRVTEDHKFYMTDKLNEYTKTASELVVGEQFGIIPMNSFGNYKKFTLGNDLRTTTYKQDIVFNEELAYVMGVYLSDGYCYNNSKDNSGSFTVVGKAKNSKFILEALNKFNPKIYTKSKNYYIITVSTRAFSEWVCNNFGNKETKHIPDFVYQSPKSVINSLLSGLIDSDSRITTRLSFINTNENLVRGVSTLSTLIGNHMYFTSENYNSKIGDKKYSGRLYSAVFLSKPDINLLVKNNKFNKIKFSDKNYGWKIDKSDLKNYPYNNGLYLYKKGQSNHLSRKLVSQLGLRHQYLIPVTITDIEPCEIDALVMETETHKFIAEGMKSSNCNFGIIYGMGPGRLVQQLDDIDIKISLTKAKSVLAAWDKKFSTAVSYLNSNVNYFMNHLVLITPWGRKRHGYRKFIDNAKLSSQQRESKNFMVQSFASDIVLLIIVRMAPALRKIGARMLATVHDSILIECPKDKVEQLKKICKKYMWLKLPELHGHMVKSGLEISEKSWGDKEEVDLNNVIIEKGEIL